MVRITILPGSPSSAANGRCQQVHFMVSGDVSSELLNSVKTSEKMGAFRESDSCTTDHSQKRRRVQILPRLLEETAVT
ncbi:uncharacterized protein cusr [Aulostomus maculatus]